MASRIMERGSRAATPTRPKAPAKAKPAAPRTSHPLNRKAGTSPKTRAKTSAARPTARRRNPLPRITKQAGQTVLLVPLPRIRLKPLVKTARRLSRAAPRIRRLTIPIVGMRTVAAMFFFGAMAYSLMPGTLSVLRLIPGSVGDVFRTGLIASTFSPEVQRWSGELAGWAETYGLDVNLLATVMQIESCGHPTARSSANAQGLFQVMPFHFADGEQMTDPNTNAMRGAGVLKECLRWSNGDTRGALACYNGGPSLLSRPTDTWPAETQRYVVWGEGIYSDAQANAESATLDAWLRAGGAGLCSASRTVSKP